MADHDTIILEEPHHPSFQMMLDGEMDLGEYVIESGTEFPEFTRKHGVVLQTLHAKGKALHQVEPYLDHLLHIQFFLAEGHRPDEISKGTIEHQVYLAERHATGKLIEYYNAVNSDHFDQTLQAMMDFARADAARFHIRDKLRSRAIIDLLQPEQDTYIEAGPMHQSLYGFLQKGLPKTWILTPRSLEEEIINERGVTTPYMAPGDLLTLGYLENRPPSQDQQRLLCARTLIYNKISIKEEISESDTPYPHLMDDILTIERVSALDFQQCLTLYTSIKHLLTRDARKVVFGQ